MQEILQDMNQRNENKNVEIDPYTWSTLTVDARDFVGSLQKGFEKIKIYRELEFVGKKRLVDAKGQKLISWLV